MDRRTFLATVAALPAALVVKSDGADEAFYLGAVERDAPAPANAKPEHGTILSIRSDSGEWVEIQPITLPIRFDGRGVPHE